MSNCSAPEGYAYNPEYDEGAGAYTYGASVALLSLMLPQELGRRDDDPGNWWVYMPS